jgi:hypothetical protein
MGRTAWIVSAIAGIPLAMLHCFIFVMLLLKAASYTNLAALIGVFVLAFPLGYFAFAFGPGWLSGAAMIFNGYLWGLALSAGLCRLFLWSPQSKIDHEC